MSATSDEANNVVASTPGIGYRLQQAREHKKLSIADTASQLRFTRATVIHLEQEEWDQLHSRIYARGYLLSYAKFLGLPSDDMLSAFNAQYGDAERPSSLLVSKTLPVEKPFPWRSSLLVLIVLIIGALIYQYWPQQNFTSSQQLGTETINDNVELSLQTAAAAQRLDDDIDIQPNPQNAQDTRDVSKLNELPATALMIEALPLDIDSSAQQNLSEPLPAIAEINAAEAMAVNNQATPVEASPPLTNGEVQLTLVVTEASWVEVKDNGGNTLISRVLEQETVDLTGPPPLAVRVGNVAGTNLRFNNEVVDLETYRQNNIARLTLGAES